MGLDKLEEMFLFAIQGEINDSKTYLDLSERVEHSFLKTKLKFLAEEEERHKATLEEMYRVYYPGKDIVIPPDLRGPGLNITFMNENQLVKILETAMEFEKAAEKYYLSIADELSDDLESSTTLTYFAAMEATHYDLLKTEKEHLES
jgi:rubrerythrin